MVASVAALFLPLARVDAVLAGMMAGLLVQAGAAIWAFAARTALLAWGGMVLPGAALGTALLVQGGAFAR